MSELKLLGIAGSLRTRSTNKGLLRAAQSLLPADTVLELADLSDIPFYNADVTTPPPSVQRVFSQLAHADGLLLACPEYNYSMAPALKNILDWASREPDNRLLAGKAVAIMGAGGGMGTSRAQYHLRQVCVFLDLHPLNKPEFFANAFTGGFDEQGNLIDETLREALRKQLQALAVWIRQLQK